MNLYSIPPLTGALLAFAIGMLVLLHKNTKSKANIIFALFCFSIFGWLFPYAISYSNKNPSSALLWAKAGCMSVDFAGPLLYLFVVKLLGLKGEMKWVRASFLALVFVFILCLKSNCMFLNEPRQYFWGYYPNAGPFHPLAILLHSVVIMRTLIILYGAMRIKEKFSWRQYNQIKYIFYGLWFLVFPGLIDYLPKYGITIYPFGWSFVVIFCAVIAYAMLKHNFLDINLIIEKSLVYSVLAAIITAVFFSVFLIVEKFFQGMFGYQSIFFTSIAGFFIALSFAPLRNKIQYFIDKLFYRKSHEEISEENRRLRLEIERSERLRSVGTLAAGMAHEIKNPLTAIKTFTEFLPDLHNDPKFMRKFNHIVGPEVNRINNIVNNILSFSRPNTYKEEQVNIQQALDDIVELMSNTFIQRRLAVEKDYHLNGQRVTGDTEQLKQVFLNILLNAAEAMTPGGKVTVTTEQNPTDGEVTISIADTGCGINKKDLKKIFDPFYTNKKGGTGLGLAVVQDILKRHNVKAKINSVVGKGTEFRISFCDKHDKNQEAAE